MRRFTLLGSGVIALLGPGIRAWFGSWRGLSSILDALLGICVGA